MRGAAFAIVACLAVCALADDAQKPGAPNVVGADEWAKQVAEVAKTATQAERVAALRKLASGTLIERRGKIRDFVKDVDHEEIVSVAVCGVYGGPGEKTFSVGAGDLETVAKWRRWDRLAWNERARVADSGEISFEVATPLVACVRTPNPGFEPPPQEKATANADAFGEWLKNFGRSAYEQKNDVAADLWKSGAATTWILPALTHRLGNGTIVVHLQIDGNWEKWVLVPTGQYMKGGRPVMREELAGRWGFTKWADLPIVTDDPQAVALMTDQTSMDVAVDLPADGAKAAIQKTPFKATIRPWKIKGKK
jgi:hypothetical protein